MIQPKLNAQEMITRAKVQLQDKDTGKPFFSYILLHMYEKDVGNAIPSMGVDRNGKMIFNPHWIETLSYEELVGCICHEAMHVVLQHLFRNDKRDPLIWNVAADAIVNDILLGEGMELPKEVIKPIHHRLELNNGTVVIENLDEKFAESVYDELQSKLPKAFKGGGKGDGKGMQGFDVHIYGDDDGDGDGDGDKDGKGNAKGSKGGMTKKTASQLAKHWDRVLAEAVEYGKQQGSVPMGMERMVSQLLAPKVNWRHVLHKAIVNVLPYDYTWRTPSKRSIAVGYYMPSTYKENVEVICTIDTSGSIGQQELTQFISEMVSIARSFPNLTMTVIDCDADVHSVMEVTDGNIQKLLDMKPLGGGGTSHEPVYRWINEKRPRAKLLVNFTDGFTDFPDEKDVNIDTLWVLTENSCPKEDIPFGDVIKLE